MRPQVYPGLTYIPNIPMEVAVANTANRMEYDQTREEVSRQHIHPKTGIAERMAQSQMGRYTHFRCRWQHCALIYAFGKNQETTESHMFDMGPFQTG